MGKVNYINLIDKFLADEISDREMILLQSWLEQDSENRIIFDNENELWQETNFHLQKENYNTDTAWCNVSNKLGLGVKNVTTHFFQSRKGILSLLAAASFALYFGVVWFIQLNSEKATYQQDPVAWTTIMTQEGEKAHIILSDSTEIILNSGSSVKYNGQYNLKSREVNLLGEAFFNVRTNQEKPFVVDVNGIKIVATGTSFNVCAFKNDDRVETTLEEGKIQVSFNGIEPVNLIPGQHVVYFPKSNQLKIYDVPVGTYSSWKEDKLRFIEAPLEDILRRIGRKYNVEFEIKNSDLLNLRFTATFLDESLEEVMQMLQTVSPLTYKIYKSPSNNYKEQQKHKIVLEMKKSNIKNI